MSAGEAVGTTVFEWAREALGVTINEMFGQTEMNYIVGNSQELWPAKPGSMGRPYPGHRIEVDRRRRPHASRDGEIGEVAVNRIAPDGNRDPIFFLEYFKNPEGTARKFAGDWCRTGDLAKRDADGYLWYQGRADDMFKAAGYRIGPSEIENCLVAASGGGERRGGPVARRDARQRRQGVHRAGRGSRRRRRRSRTTSSSTSAARSRRTNTRRRSSSSTRCR